MKTLQTDPHQGKFPCEQCLYFSRNLDPEISSSYGASSPITCALEFTPGDDQCIEWRKSSCGARKNK